MWLLVFFLCLIFLFFFFSFFPCAWNSFSSTLLSHFSPSFSLLICSLQIPEQFDIDSEHHNDVSLTAEYAKEIFD